MPSRILNKYTIGACYEAFDTTTAWLLIRRMKFRRTTKHGRWLNIEEKKLSVLTRQCVNGCRFPTIGEMGEENAAWNQYTNDKQRGVEWQFRIEDVRTKLKSLYSKTARSDTFS